MPKYRTNHCDPQIESDSLIDLTIRGTYEFWKACKKPKSDKWYEPARQALDYALTPIVIFYFFTVGRFEYRVEDSQKNQGEETIDNDQKDNLENKLMQKQEL